MAVAEWLPWRRQPPAYAPLPARTIARALDMTWRLDDPRRLLTEELASLYDAPVVHLTHSGTAALLVAIRLARAFTGDGPVALPAFGCYDLAAAAVGAAAPIVLYDVDPHTLAPDLGSLAAQLVGGARLVVIAPFAGVPVAWREISDCLASYGAMAIEDAAQGHGASWHDHKLGSLGAISVLSFGRTKGWTGARGGAVLVRDPAIAQFARGLSLPEPGSRMNARVLADALSLWGLAGPSKYAIPASLPWLHLGETRYHVPQQPCRMAALSAALLRAGQGAADAESAQRRVNARVFIDALPVGTHVQSVVPPSDAECGYLRFPVRVTGGWDDFAGIGPARRLGIAPTYPTTLAALPQVRARLRSSGPWPGAETLVREMITLPTHSLVTPDERQIILDLLVRWQRGRHAARNASPWFSARSYNAT